MHAYLINLYCCLFCFIQFFCQKYDSFAEGASGYSGSATVDAADAICAYK